MLIRDNACYEHFIKKITIMAISYNKVRENYTIVPNLVINDKQLPMQSKFIYIYMLSKPDGWNFYQKAMCDDLGMSGRYA